ncbi:MAG: family 20 glycosylhydrolase [Lachnospiraceae bacterium]|nr:family 20 glycosylhydrolase [Lachnospiraceae bacterium]
MERFDYLIPAVRGRAEKGSGRLALPMELGVEYGGFASWCVTVFMDRTGRKPGGQDIILFLNRKEELAEEGYEITITKEKIQVSASTERGVVWALTTVALLLEEESVPCGTISDSPKYQHRGLSVDCARHFFPAAEIKKIIEEISLAKMNVLHWHLTDDQGWRIESRRFPGLQKMSGQYYSQEEIREVCEYARLRGVEIIPEVDMPGHVSALLAAYPQYSCGEKPVKIKTGGGIFPVILCAGKEAVFDFLKDLLMEVTGLFPGERFHLGGDEAPKTEWKKCPCCQAKMLELGLEDWEELQGYFMSRVSEILAGLGKTAVCWNETLCAANHPQKMQAQYWTLEQRKAMEPYALAGKEWIYSDMFELYLDYPYSMTNLKKVYETIPHLGEEDVSGKEGLLGMEGCLWSEHITKCEKLEKLLFPRIYALADNTWSGADKYEEFTSRLTQAIASPLHQGILYTSRDWWTPTGPERQQEAFAYMASLSANMSEEVKEETMDSSSASNEEFGRAFMTKFFQPEDIPILMGEMQK